MATKKFIIEVEEGRTKCEECPFYIFFPPMCNGAPNGLECRKTNLATIKIKEGGKMKECYKSKTSYEIQKASEGYILKTHIDDASVQDHFIAGAEWMQEKMQETNEGQALLYAVEKTAERTKREMIEKAVKWMYNYFVIDHYGMTSAGFGLFELAFKQAMQDESK